MNISLLIFTCLCLFKVISLTLVQDKINIHTAIWFQNFTIGISLFNIKWIWLFLEYRLLYVGQEQGNVNLNSASGVRSQEENGIGVLIRSTSASIVFKTANAIFNSWMDFACYVKTIYPHAPCSILSLDASLLLLQVLKGCDIFSFH